MSNPAVFNLEDLDLGLEGLSTEDARESDGSRLKAWFPCLPLIITIYRRDEPRGGGGPEIRTKIPYVALFRNRILAFLSLDIENRGNYDSEILIDDDRCASCKFARFARSADHKLFHFLCTCIIKT